MKSPRRLPAVSRGPVLQVSRSRSVLFVTLIVLAAVTCLAPSAAAQRVGTAQPVRLARGDVDGLPLRYFTVGYQAVSPYHRAIRGDPPYRLVGGAVTGNQGYFLDGSWSPTGPWSMRTIGGMRVSVASRLRLLLGGGLSFAAFPWDVQLPAGSPYWRIMPVAASGLVTGADRWTVSALFLLPHQAVGSGQPGVHFVTELRFGIAF